MDKQVTAEKFIKLIEIVEILRGPEGCPWDKDQTNESLLPYFLEEAYELIESVDIKDWDTFKEELGDIMLHVVLQAQISRENYGFDLFDSIDTVNKKLIRRHPHVFGEKKANVAYQAKKNWEEVKHQEKKRRSRLDGVPKALPALVRAQRLQEKASYAGFDWDKIEGVWDKVHEEILELKEAQKNNKNKHIEEEIGDLLFTIVNLARFLNISAENALRKANLKFTNRFFQMEKEMKKQNKSLRKSTMREMDKIWDILKKRGD